MDKSNTGWQSAALVGAGAVMVGLSGCRIIQEQTQAVTGPTPPSYLPLPDDDAALRSAIHVLNRAAWGPRPGDVAHVAAMGVTAWLEEQLADKMDEDPAVTWRVNGLDVQQNQIDSPDSLNVLDDGQLLRETQQAAILRAAYSRHQLREVLADFWTNHFNIYAIKNDGRFLVPVDTERVIRPHVLGNFRDMLYGSANSPAMLAYLDNNQNRKGVANENYARELLELHTVGVHGGYTLTDIQVVARCFTGWTVQDGFTRGLFSYEDHQHDKEGKYIPFLNLVIPRNGDKRDAEKVLDVLSTHPATAKFLATKLCRWFLGYSPDAVVEKAANAFLRSKGDIRATIRPILLDALPQVKSSHPIMKRPFDFLVTSLRAIGADSDGGEPLQKHLAAMGQPLYQWPMPDGFPTKAEAWTGSLLPRWNYAMALTANQIGGTEVNLDIPFMKLNAKDDTSRLNVLIETLLARHATDKHVKSTKDRVSHHIERARANSLSDKTVATEMAALLLASPEFQWR